jgi:N-methylhydantoinase A/oxoprolinase/acetone carboxylase beta subunit
MSNRIPCRLGVDIGGTFTDIVLMLTNGSVTTRKVPSTPADYSVGIVEYVDVEATALRRQHLRAQV